MFTMRSTVLALILAAGCTSTLVAQQQLPPGAHDPDEQKQPAAAPDPLGEIEGQIAQKDYTGARAKLDVYLSTHPNDARALFDSGYIEDALGKDDAAAAGYRHAIKVDPKQFEAHLSLGLLLARLNEAEEAKTELEAATKLEPSEPDPAAKGRAWRALAQLTRNIDPSEAKQALLEALKITPETPDDVLLTAEIAEASQDNETAEVAYRRVLAQQPDSPAATAGLAHLLIAQKKYVDAEPLIRAALQKNPGDPALNSQLASLLLEQNKTDEALDLMKKVHDKAPTDPAVNLMYAHALMTAGDVTTATTIYEQLLQVQPDNPDLLEDYAQCLIHQQRYNEAIAQFQKALHLDQNDAEAWGGLAFAASEAHQPQLTLQALSMRSKITPDTPPTYFLKATAYDNLHQNKAAAEAYRQFLETAGGKFPNQEWQAKQRLAVLEKRSK